MTNLDAVGAWVGDRLSGPLAEHDVPGAAVAVAAGGEVVDHAVGLLSTATGVEATTDSVFQISSITEVWTATLVMQLVDEGLLADLGGQGERTELVGCAERSLIPRQAQHGTHLPHVFVGDDGAGRVQHLHIGRAVRRAPLPAATTGPRAAEEDVR